MVKDYESIIAINDRKNKWCFFARIIGLWKCTDPNNSDMPLKIDLVLQDNYGHKIDAQIGRDLIPKFHDCVKEDGVYIMYNFHVTLNHLEVKTTSHTYYLNFTNHTRIKVVDDETVPMYSYFFSHPSTFLSKNYRSENLVDVIGMLSKVEFEDDYFIEGEMKKIVSMDLTNYEYRYKCILHGAFYVQLSEFLLSKSPDNVCIALFFGKMTYLKGIPTVQNFGKYTKLIFNPNYEAALDLKQRLDITFSPSYGVYETNETTEMHILKQWLYSNTRSTIYDLRTCAMESMCVILGKVQPMQPGRHWCYLSCVCNIKVIPDGHRYYCERCNRHVLMVNHRYMISLRVSDPTASATFVMHDRMAVEFFGMSCSQMLEIDGKDAVSDYVPEPISKMVGKCYLFMVFTKVSPGDDADKCYPVSKVTDDDALIQSFKRQQSLE
ncbi:hypothetical protein P8452_52706 [Trifolium repens]|nr:hypothetical protein P8452_52706 [Trifolium repens]